ncbi:MULTISPECIES: GntR family transcriptional regulator [unclassified Streptomyces]|uniref:GntR family transcriptional regulator n=1 Tax=unclassified Streptomyces TaxID=2593676 RepID=UPI002E808257|nr:GntR family transcriptional regulator [Streptomyces sp. NBC_00503]WUD85027.1 GntR family transcriptional regulator [Streptomyces sp. NBC_00503]
MTDDAAIAAATSAVNASDPLWSQASDRIREEIARRGLSAGSKLPPERELCTRLDVSRVTLRRALAHLVDQGLVTASHGRGWFVAAPVPPAPAREWPKDLESFTATARRKHMRASSVVLHQETVTASLDDADRLDVPAGTPLLRLERVRLLNEVRIALDRTLVVAELAPDLTRTDFREASLFEELRRWGVEPDRAEATIEARTADGELAGHLGIAEGAPVLVLDQTVYTRDQRPLLLSTVEYSGDRYRLRTTLQTD